MKKYGKHTILGWSWRTLLGVVLTPFVLFALLAILVYCPPVQKWAVDKAADWLSDEMGMEVSVQNVRLKFPLDLSMGGILAIQEGDTVLNAEELRLSVQARPLLDKQINVDDIILRNADVNTRELIDAVLIKGHIGELQAYTHGVDLEKQLVTVNQLNLSNSKVLIAIADTVPPDTTESEPTRLKLDFQDIVFKKVNFSLALAQDKGYSVKELHELKSIPTDLDTYFNDAKCLAFIDLENSAYTVNNLEASNSAVRFDNDVNLKDVNIKCDSARYADTMNLYVKINQLSGKEECGINFNDVQGTVRMDTLKLYLDDLDVTTDDSKMNINMQMDWTTWDDVNPGIIQVDLKSTLGKSNVLDITHYIDRFLDKDSQLTSFRDLVKQYMPSAPTPLQVSVIGNLNDLQFNEIHTNLKGFGRLEGSARLRGDVVSTKLRADLLGGNAKAEGSYNINDESYDINLILNDFNVNKYVETGERTRLTGKIHAKGKGFDIYSPKTIIDGTADIQKGCYGKIDLSSVNATASLKNSQLDLRASCSNSQLNTDFCLAGMLRKGIVDGSLDIDLPYADIRSMGFSKDTLTVKTRGQMDFYSNLDNLFRVNGFMNGLDLTMGSNNIKTRDFQINAETTRDSTYAHLLTGDFTFDFKSPNNLFTLVKKWDKLSDVADAQMRSRNVNLDRLKQYMPYAKMSCSLGSKNPLATILAVKGIKFDEIVADINSSPESGVTGNGHLYTLRYDTIRIDTAYFDVHQDSSRIAFRSGVKCEDQSMFPAFHAKIDGYYGLTDADVHLQFFNKKNEQGIDIGVHFVDQDTVTHATLYPAQPILGYRRFTVNDDNYIDFYRQKNHPIVGYVRLAGIDDNSVISVTGIDYEGDQRALVEIDSLKLGELCKVVPFIPSMDGIFNIDAAYQEKDDWFWVDGMLDIENFVYEDMKVGNVGSTFNYEPEGEGLSIHNVEGDISYEGVDVASLTGRYDAKGDGYLNADLDIKELPMKMLSPFVPDQIIALDGSLGGAMSIKGPTDKLQIDGYAVTDSVVVSSPYYAVNLRLDDDTIRVANSKVTFDKYKIFGADENTLTLNGFVDFSNMDKMLLSLQVGGKNVQLINSKRNNKSVVFGHAYGDIYAMVSGSSDELKVRGYVNVLPKTDCTYIMTDNAISQGERLDDIVTFVDFELPPDTTAAKQLGSIMGIDMKLNLNVQDGSKFRVEISADKQSYVDFRCGGSLTLIYTPEGVMNAQGKLTVNEGEMKYALSFIPLKTFTLENGSYVEFTGDLYDPTLNITATETTKAQVTKNNNTRGVKFLVGLTISQTLNDIGLGITLSAPEDTEVQQELNDFSDEEKQKLAIALLATGMYMSDTNSSAITANNALSSFIQSQLNSLTSRALGNFIDVSLGMDQRTYDDGSIGNDYSFKFSKRFFNDRLNVVIGGRVSDNASWNRQAVIGDFIDDVSLEWRLDNSATRYVTVFHRKDYDNIVEGVLDKNGAGIVLRKKLSSVSDLMFWKKKKTETAPAKAEEKRKQTPSQSAKEEENKEAMDERKEEKK